MFAYIMLGGGGRSALQLVQGADVVTAGGGGGGADCRPDIECGGGGTHFLSRSIACQAYPIIQHIIP